MKRSFLINLSFLIIVNLLVKPFYIFGIDRVVQNRVGAEEYGLYIALFNFTFLFQIINDFGIQQFNNRNISQNRQLLEKYFPNILFIKIILAAIYTLFILAAGSLTGYTFSHFELLSLFVFNQILVSITFYLRSNLSALGYYKTDSLLSIVDRLLLIFIVGYLLWFWDGAPEFQIEWFVYAQTFTLSITFLLAFILAFNKLNYWKFKFKMAIPWLILRQSWPYALAIFLMTIYTYTDVVMIERMLEDGKYQAGAYGAGYRLLDAFNMFGYLFTMLLLPMLSKLLVKSIKETASLTYFSFQIIMAGTIPIAIGAFFFRFQIMEFLYKEATPYWGNLMGILILTFIAMSCTYIFITLLTANDSLKQMNKILILGFVLNFTLNLILIPKFKAYGAAISTLVCQFAMAISLMILAHYDVKIAFQKRVWAKIFLFALICISINALMINFLLIDWKWGFILGIFASLLFAVLLKLLNFQILLNLIKNKEAE